MSSQWRFWHNYLGGITAERLRVLLSENRVDPGFHHRTAFLRFLSYRNSMLSRREVRLYGKAIESTRLEESPLFVLGHWRGGTTHLHNLLACDTEHFASPNNVHVTFPHTFLTTEADTIRRFGSSMPGTRPMDNVEIRLDSPQEDEFATCSTSLRSPFLGMASFPRRADYFDRFLTFRRATPAETEEWRASFLWFLRKVTLKLQRPLLLKSPPHTARIRLLLELFPRARFVHIHRDPYAVFKSTRHLFTSTWPIHALQSKPPDVEGDIIRRYRELYEAFHQDQPHIPEGQYHEVSYAELTQEPLRTVHAIYERFGLKGFEAVRPRLETYLATLGDYRPNTFTELPDSVRERVAQEWGRSFETWGYRC